MAERRQAENEDPGALSPERAGRLYRLLAASEGAPQPRTALVKTLGVGLRTIYRDLELLRSLGVALETGDRGYELRQPLEEALALVPFPNPKLTFAEALQLQRGRTKAHRRLKQFVEQVIG